MSRSRSLGLLGVMAFLFGIQAFTGVLLMLNYSPATTTAWAGVWYIQTRVPFGWLIRGIHVLTTDCLIVLSALTVGHLLWTGRFTRTGRRIWWALLGLTLVIVLFALTGYVLPWDQRAFWGTTVRLNILAGIPLLGPGLRSLIGGGVELGNSTLTRSYALHVFILPVLAVVLAAVGTGMNRRIDPAHPLKESTPPHRGWIAPAGRIWGAVLLIAIMFTAWCQSSRDSVPWLDAPADRQSTEYPARPEWWALALFQWLKYFEGPVSETVASVVVPGLLILIAFLLPYFCGGVRPATVRTGARGAVLLMSSVWIWLTWMAVRGDRIPADPDPVSVGTELTRPSSRVAPDRRTQAAREFRVQKIRANHFRKRALTLADMDGIPPTGPLEMLAHDPLTQGPQLFSRNCAGCHRYHGHDGFGVVPEEPETASDLGDFASAIWIRSFLENPLDDRFFGRARKADGTPAHTRMSKWLERTKEEQDAAGSLEDWRLRLDAVAAYLESESRWPGVVASRKKRRQSMEGSDGGGSQSLDANPSNSNPETSSTSTDFQAPDDAAALGDLDANWSQLLLGRTVFEETCNECHSDQGIRLGTISAPEMHGYGSPNWIEFMVANPDHPERYGSTGREPALMPAFGNTLSAAERSMLARWLFETRNLTPHTSNLNP